MNSARIFLVGDDNTGWIPMVETPYEQEVVLQQALADYPDLLPGDQINPEAPRRWLLVRRELGIPGTAGGGSVWSLDHLFLDQDGIPTFVECKRSNDTRSRREVVGQMLDYAANAVAYWPVDAIRTQFEAACESQGRDSEQLVRELVDATLDDEAVVEPFWQRVKTNLQAGKIRMVFVADEIPTQLRRIVEFLNEQMDPAEVLAVELRQYVGKGLKAIVPRVIGQTAEAQQKKRTGGQERRKWDEAAFFEVLVTQRSTAEADVAHRILDWIQPKVTRIWWGEGRVWGSFVPTLNYNNIDYQLFATWTIGTVEIYFQWLQYKPPFDAIEKRQELLRRLNDIPGVSLPADAIVRRPTIPLNMFVDETNLNQLLDVFHWVIQQILAS